MHMRNNEKGMVNRMIKGFTSVFVALIFLFAVVSCGNSGDETESPQSNAVTKIPHIQITFPEENAPATMVVKTNEIYGGDYDYYPIVLFVDKNGCVDVDIDNFAEVDFSLYTKSDTTGSIIMDSHTTIYTVSDGIITEGTIDDITSQTMAVINYFFDEDGNQISDIYIYIQ